MNQKIANNTYKFTLYNIYTLTEDLEKNRRRKRQGRVQDSEGEGKEGGGESES